MSKILIASALVPLIEKEKSILNREDFRIFVANSGEEALNIHRAERMNLIIADIDLPGKNGDELCALIRSDDSLKKVSIIVICSGRKAEIERCANSGANSFITKPVDSAKFMDEVVRLLNIPERKAYRVLIKVDVKGSCMNASFFCSSANISSSGILLETEKPLAKGDIISCSFYLPNTERISVDGEIMRVVRTAIKTFHYGVKFIDLDAGYKAAIDALAKR